MLLDLVLDSLKIAAAAISVYYGGWIAALGILLLLYLTFVAITLYQIHKTKTPL